MLSQQTKKTVFPILIGSIFALICLIVNVFYPFMNIYSFIVMFPSITNNNAPKFYGENIDMSQILPTSQHYIVNNKGQDLIDIAADLGVNLVRITNIQQSFNNNLHSVYTRDQWNQVLNKMQNKGIKTIILIETASANGDYYTPKIQPIYLNLVREYINSGVFSNSDVYAVDLKNEPLLTDANISMIRAAHIMIKKKYPALRQTVGWWAVPRTPINPYNHNNYNWSDYSAGQKLSGIVDFYSIHKYGLGIRQSSIHLDPELETKVFVSAVENGLQTKKPILIEEFGEANGDVVSDQDTIGSPQLQANVYQGVYQALKAMHSSQIIGAVAFDFYSRSPFPDAWAIVKNHGNYLFPAAYILQEYALGIFNPSLKSKTVDTSQSYLITNTGNHTTKNLRISDRIGLKLRLNDSQNYSLYLTGDNMLRTLASFYHDPGSNYYYAVYQAISKGNEQLNIIPSINLMTGNIYTDVVYTLNIYST